MGQLFNRMFRMAKSYLNDVEVKGYHVNSEDEELKKIIDELNKKEKKQQEQKSSSSQKSGEQKKAREGYEQKMGLDMAYKVLGVGQHSSVEEIKTAYKKKMREYHPDLVSSMGDEIKELAAHKTKLINEAYAFIREARGF